MSTITSRGVQRFIDDDATVDEVELHVQADSAQWARRFFEVLKLQQSRSSLAFLSVNFDIHLDHLGTCLADALIPCLVDALMHTRLNEIGTLELNLDRIAPKSQAKVLEGLNQSGISVRSLVLRAFVCGTPIIYSLSAFLVKTKTSLKHLELRMILCQSREVTDVLTNALSQLELKSMKPHFFGAIDPVYELEILLALASSSLEDVVLEANPNILTSPVFVAAFIAKLNGLKTLEIEGDVCGLDRQNDFAAFCRDLADALQSQCPSLDSIVVRRERSSVLPLQLLSPAFAPCRKISLHLDGDFGGVSEEQHIIAFHAVIALLRACTNVETLQVYGRRRLIQGVEELNQVAVALRSSCRRLKKLCISGIGAMANDARPEEREGMVRLVRMMPPSFAELQVRKEGLHSYELSWELAKRGMHYEELVDLPSVLWPFLLAKQRKETEFDEKANLQVLYQFLQAKNPVLFGQGGLP